MTNIEKASARALATSSLHSNGVTPEACEPSQPHALGEIRPQLPCNTPHGDRHFIHQCMLHRRLQPAVHAGYRLPISTWPPDASIALPKLGRSQP